ncbi:MAG: GGDEF domain-containing protein, partial [Nitrospinota bacterium]|nr:GGDEF domain-containing protein [Nitrospinota bacterium]
GLHNRRWLDEFLPRQMSRARMADENLSVAMIDVDHFKSVNDNYGHPAGDRILKKLSALLKSITRKEDINARFGGEEFIILLPGTNEKNAITIAEKIRLQAEKSLIIRQKNRSPKKVTVSAGVSSFSETVKTGTGLLASVDQYLYLAKNTGRNRVCSTIHDELQENVDEKRRNQRCPVSLKFCNGNNFIQFIELSVNNQWKICVLDNLSKSGFKGSIEFEMPENHNNVDFRVFSGHEAISNDIYKGVVAFNNQIMNGRYSIGVKITDKPKKWENLFSRISV